MVDVGDKAPEIEGLVVNEDLEKFKLSEKIGEGPVVVAFFPAAFAPPCTNELLSLQNKLDDFQDEGAEVFGVSVDNPFALQAFKEDKGFEFPLVSDNDSEAVQAYDVKTSIEEVDFQGVANRAVFVIDEDGEVTYRWIAEDNLNGKCLDELIHVLKHVRENY